MIEKFHDEVYGVTLTVFIGSANKYKAYVKRMEKRDYKNELYDAKFDFFEDTKAYIWMPEFDWTINDQATLMHELYHFVFHVMDSKSVKLCADSDEVFAYYFEFWVKILYRALLKYRDKKI